MSFYAKHKQLIDQSAHVAVAFLFVVAASLAFLSPGMAWWLMMTIALLRELHQHDWGALGDGSIMDLGFFALGGILGVVALA